MGVDATDSCVPVCWCVGRRSVVLIFVDLAVCVLMAIGLRLTLGWAIAFAVLCRVCIIALAVQYWFVAVCAMFGGFALLVGDGLAKALYPVQSTRDAILHAMQLRDAAAKSAARRESSTRTTRSQSKDGVTGFVSPDGRADSRRPSTSSRDRYSTSRWCVSWATGSLPHSTGSFRWGRCSLAMSTVDEKRHLHRPVHHTRCDRCGRCMGGAAAARWLGLVVFCELLLWFWWSRRTDVTRT